MKTQGLAVLLALSGLGDALSPRSSKLEACPLLGKQYPGPTSISSPIKFQKAKKILDTSLDEAIKKQALYKDTTFSISMFSASEDGLFYQYHHTSPIVANSSYGTNKVDADSIYRIGSISKLLTVYLFLLCEGDVRWSDPVSKHLPGILKDKANSWNAITPDWDAITIGDLAGQMGGLARDYGLGDLAPPSNALLPIPQHIKNSLPHLSSQQTPQCGWVLANYSLAMCSPEDYISGVANESPIFSTAYTPVYSNEGFAILGGLLQEIAKTPVETLFNNSLVKPLGLNSTYYTVPNGVSERSVIPQNPDAAGWRTDLGFFSPAGGYFSTVNDFAKLGKAILSSQLLPKSVTNRWFKPTSFVEDWAAGVGRPFEIFRLKVNGQSVDWYTKSGDWGDYHTFFGLIPHYDIGITVLTATTPTSTSDLRSSLPFVLADAVMPVLDQIAKEQAEANFAGIYTSKATNSSLTLTTAGSQSGLKVTHLVSNGADLFSYLSSIFPNLVWRLQPNQLDYGGKIGFTSYQTSAVPSNSSEQSILRCSGWFDVDPFTYGNIPLGQLVFALDESGNAKSVDLRGLRVTLERQS